jgi:hypothetical protein
VVEQSEGVSAGVYVGDVDVDEGEEDVVNGVGDAVAVRSLSRSGRVQVQVQVQDRRQCKRRTIWLLVDCRDNSGKRQRSLPRPGSATAPHPIPFLYTQ